MNLDEVIHYFQLPNPNKIEVLTGGANNRVFKLNFEGKEPRVLKQYFQHPNDLRRRLESEFSFLRYAWESGVRNIPQPIMASKEKNMALYSYIPGQAVQKVTDELIQSMADFFVALNRNKGAGRHLPRASESCFSVAEYLQITEKRIERLKGVDELSDFLTKALLPKWEAIKCKAALHSDLSIEKEVGGISPSDFGFHNALISDGQLYFIDFEYAGWDDPCKTVCDLFCQPRVPIPMHYFPFLSHTVASVAADPESCMKRIEIVLPLMQVRWCCILLNAFTQVGSQRRTFSHSDEVMHKESQLNKAREWLARI